MFKKSIVYFVFLPFLIIFLTIETVFNSSENTFTNLNGYIITGIFSDTEQNSFIINLHNKEKEIISSDISSNFKFVENQNQLLTNVANELYLYDSNSKNTNLICKINTKNQNIYNIKYIENNNICFTSKDEKLILYNIKTNEEKVLSNNITGEYSYTPDKKKIYYSIDNKIYSVDINTKSSEYITNGNNPIISKNGNILVYYKDTNHDKLIVENTINGTIWEIYETPSKYVVSPDGNYIAMVKPYDNFGVFSVFFYLGYKTVIYDYKNKKEMTLVEKYSCSDVLDWI